MFVGSIGGPIGAGLGFGIGLLASSVKTLFGKDKCSEPSTTDIFNKVIGVKEDLTKIDGQITNIGKNLGEFKQENKFDHQITQGLITDLDQKSQINFDITNSLIQKAQFENHQEFGVTQSLIKQGRNENIQSFIQTQGLVNLGRFENNANFQVTQSLISQGQDENRVNFGQTQGLINIGRLENFAGFAQTQGLIQDGRKENIENFVKTFDFINQGRIENQVNFKVTQDLVNTGRLENFAGFAKTQGMIQEGRQENLVNFAITQDLVNRGRFENQVNFGITQDLINVGRQENQYNFQVTRNLINVGREENLANFKITQELVNVGRQENLINFGITQDMIAQGRWENLLNFEAVKGAIGDLRQETVKGFSILSQQSDRNLNAVIDGRLENANNFKTTFALLDRNFEAANTGRIENFKNFKITQGLLAQVNDNVLKSDAESKAERFLYFTSTASIIKETGVKVEESVINAKVEILKAIDKSRVQPILSSLITFSTYFAEELQGLSALDEEKLVEKLLEPNGVLFILTESRTPREVNSLYSLLSDIINQNLAIPKTLNDENSFIILDALLNGVELYLNVLGFILGSYGVLAQHFNVKMELDLVNKYIILSEIRYAEYVRSLDGSLLNQVAQVLNKVQSSGFLENSQKESLPGNFQRIDQIRSSLGSFQSIINNKKQIPNAITSKPVFPDQVSQVAIGDWKGGSQVSYAVQYKIQNTFTRISPFSTKFVLSQGMNNPTITLPKAPQTVEKRFIYRKFGNNQPEYIGSVTGFNSVAFKDLDRDLFVAAGISNEGIGLPQVEALLRLGANASTMFDFGKTCFHVAAEQNNNKILRVIHKEKKDLELFDLAGKLPIHIAAEVGNLESVETLANLGADINALSFYNLNALQIASMNGHDKVINYLLKKENIKINNEDHKNFPLLHLAVIAGHLESVNELLSHTNVDINLKDGENFTALHHAVSSKHFNIFEALIATPSIDFNIAAATGLTVLHLAAIEGKLNFVEALLNLPNANSLLKTDSGLTILHLAAVNNHTSIVQLILKRVPSLSNERNNDGSTALHLAVAQQNLEVVKVLLLEGKADINAVTNDGMTALHVAASTYQNEVVAMLMLLGAKTNLKTDRGLNPLHYAAWYGRSAVSFSCLLNIRLDYICHGKVPKVVKGY